MSKWKERIDKILDAERSRLEAKYADAQANYNDTGYQRYYTQMEKIEAELDDINTYRRVKIELAKADSENRRYRNAIATFRQQMSDYKLNHKGVERPIEETVDALASKLSITLSEGRLL